MHRLPPSQRLSLTDGAFYQAKRAGHNDTVTSGLFANAVPSEGRTLRIMTVDGHVVA